MPALPQTPLATAAAAHTAEILPAWLFAHSVRCFLFGRAYAACAGLSFDEDALFVAALFHDLGLVPPYDDRYPDVPQFKDPVVALLDVATGMDVTGSGLERLDAGLVSQIVMDNPRQGFANRFVASCVDLAQALPHRCVNTFVEKVAGDAFPESGLVDVRKRIFGAPFPE